jgi:hypothetical protein
MCTGLRPTALAASTGLLGRLLWLLPGLLPAALLLTTLATLAALLLLVTLIGHSLTPLNLKQDNAALG